MNASRRFRTTWHVERLGPVPTNLPARAVWCHSAYQLETDLDYSSAGTRPDVGWDVAATRQICAVDEQNLRLAGPADHPHQWAQVADRAQELHQVLFVDRHDSVQRPQLERGRGLELGS
jgi:hypothetical protein